MLKNVIKKIRTMGHEVLTTRRGDHIKAVRVSLELLNIANELVGRPFRPEEELTPTAAPRAAQSTRTDGPAPVMIYTEAKDHITLDKIETLLKAASVPYKVLDVSRDEATQSWLTTAAKGQETPVVFIAGEFVGGLRELTDLDVNGTLKKKVFN